MVCSRLFSSQSDWIRTIKLFRWFLLDLCFHPRLQMRDCSTFGIFGGDYCDFLASSISGGQLFLLTCQCRRVSLPTECILTSSCKIRRFCSLTVFLFIRSMSSVRCSIKFGSGCGDGYRGMHPRVCNVPDRFSNHISNARQCFTYFGFCRSKENCRSFQTHHQWAAILCLLTEVAIGGFLHRI